MKPPTPDRVTRRVLERFEVDSKGCWVSLYAANSVGYAHAAWREDGIKYHVMVHRVAYEALVGPIPPPLTVDHMCLNTKCINPEHLRLLTLGENAGEPRRRRRHCPYGHPYDEANTYVDPRGWRKCRTCRSAEDRIRNEQRKLKKKEHRHA